MKRFVCEAMKQVDVLCGPLNEPVNPRRQQSATDENGAKINQQGTQWMHPGEAKVSPKPELGEHTRLGCCWTRLAASPFCIHRWWTLCNLPARSWFSSKAQKTAHAARPA